MARHAREQSGMEEWAMHLALLPNWTTILRAPAFVKISTNDPKTGIGNGIFYIRPRDDLLVGTYGVKGADNQEQDVTEELKAKPAAPTESGLPDDNSFNAVLPKCIAQTCEEEMDTK